MSSLVRVFLNPLDKNSLIEYPVEPGTLIIDFLQKEYPDGFGAMIRVFAGIEEIDLDDLDYVIQDQEQITILAMPGVAEGVIVSAIISALVATAIGFVINLIFPPKTPSGGFAAEESAVYSLNPTRNQARLGEPVEVSYGVVSAPPSFASAPYIFFFEGSDDQYVDEMLCIGQGDYQLLDLFVGDTPISALERGSVRWWMILPSQHNQRLGNIEQYINSQTAGTDCPFLWSENVFTSPEIGDPGFEFNTDQSETVTSSGLSGTVYAGTTAPDTGEQLLDRIEGVDSNIAVRAGDTMSIAGSNLNDGDFVVGSVVPDVDDPSIMTIYKQWAAFGTFLDETLLDPPVTYEINQTNDNLSAGPYRCQKEDMEVYRIDCDMIFPNGIHLVDEGTGDIKYTALSYRFTYQRIDQDGNPLGAPIFKDRKWNENRQDTIRTTVTSGAIPIGQYEVTVERIAMAANDPPGTPETFVPTFPNAYVIEKAIWSGLKGYVQHDRTVPAYGDTTILCVRLKATNGVAQAAQSRIRAVTERINLPLPSNNPAQVIQDIWENKTYGMGRPIEDFDTVKLNELGSSWSNAGVTFNGSFDQRSSGFEAMDSVASMLGAKIVQQGGLTSIVQDKLQPIRVAMFSSANIVRGSFKIDYSFDTDSDFDSVRVSYRDPNTFEELFKTAPVDGVNPDSYTAFGCTDSDYAQKFAQYLWNTKTKRRKKVTFETEYDGLTVQFGDRIGVSHPMPDWGQSGVFIRQIDSLTWMVDQPLVWSDTKDNYLVVRASNGAPSSKLLVTRGDADNIVVFAETPPDIYPPEEQDPSSYAFGLIYELIQDFMVTKVTPRGDMAVQVEAQVYAASLYTGAPGHMTDQVVVYCDKFGVTVGGETMKMEYVNHFESSASSEDHVYGQLRSNSLLAVKGSQVYWTIREGGTDAPPTIGRNKLYFNENYKFNTQPEDWKLAIRPIDPWTDSVWGDYVGGKNYYNQISVQSLTANEYGVYYNAIHGDTETSIMYSTGPGADTDLGHTPIFSTYTYNGTGTKFTAKFHKVAGSRVADFENPFNFLIGGGTTLYDGFCSVRKASPGDGRSAILEPTGDIVDGSKPKAGTVIKSPRYLHDQTSSVSPPPSRQCYQLLYVQGFYFYCTDSNDYWIYDANVVEIQTDNEVKKLATSEFSANANEWGSIENGYGWYYTKDRYPELSTDRNAQFYSNSCKTWGWIKVIRENRIYFPMQGVDDSSSPDVGKYKYYEAQLYQKNDVTWEEWLEFDDDERENYTPNLFALAEGEVDLSPLLIDPLAPENPQLETVRIADDTNYPGDRYILYYTFKSATDRFYMRAGGKIEADAFSEPVTVLTHDLPGDGRVSQIYCKRGGGLRLQYSETNLEFWVASIFNNGSDYSEVVCKFADPFICELEGAKVVQ